MPLRLQGQCRPAPVLCVHWKWHLHLSAGHVGATQAYERMKSVFNTSILQIKRESHIRDVCTSGNGCGCDTSARKSIHVAGEVGGRHVRHRVVAWRNAYVRVQALINLRNDQFRWLRKMWNGNAAYAVDPRILHGDCPSIVSYRATFEVMNTHSGHWRLPLR